MLEIISWLFMGIGITVCAIGFIGLFNMPDVYTKQHACGLIESFGVFFIFMSLIMQSIITGISIVTFKTIFVALLVIAMSSPSCYAFMQMLIRIEAPKYVKKADKNHD